MPKIQLWHKATAQGKVLCISRHSQQEIPACIGYARIVFGEPESAGCRGPRCSRLSTWAFLDRETDRQMDSRWWGGSSMPCDNCYSYAHFESDRPLFMRTMVAWVKRKDCLWISLRENAVVPVLLFNTHTVLLHVTVGLRALYLAKILFFSSESHTFWLQRSFWWDWDSLYVSSS